MKNRRRGFTFIELLGVIVILGLITTAGIFSVMRFLENSRRKYYSSQESMVVLAGKDYFSDYRSMLPTEIGSTNKVYLRTLVDEKYIDPVVDHNGDVCDMETSYIYVQKVDEENYQYYTVLVCSPYETAVDKKAPTVTFKPNKIATNDDLVVEMEIKDNKEVASYQYTIEKDGEVYKSAEGEYKGTIKINISLEGVYYITGTGYDTSGNKTVKKSGKYVIDKTPPDCDKISFTTETPERTWVTEDVSIRVVPHEDIYQWDFITTISSKKETIVSKQKGNKTFKLTKSGLIKGDLNAYDEAGNFCTITKNYYIDKEGPVIKSANIKSRVTEYNALNVRFNAEITDLNVIQVYISETGYNTGGTWYDYDKSLKYIDFTLSGSLDGKKRNVYIKTRDNLGNEGDKREIDYTVHYQCGSGNTKDIIVKNGTCDVTCGTGNQTNTYRTVDSKTGAICSASDFTKNDVCDTKLSCNSPKCSITVTGTQGTNNWFNGNITAILTTDKNSGSEITEYGIQEGSKPGANGKISATATTDTKSGTFYGYAKNQAQKTVECSVVYKLDKTAPACTNTSSFISWTNANRTVSKSCSDTVSGCSTESSSETISTTKKTHTFTAYSIKDNAGNTTSCPAKTIDVLVDKIAPTCSPSAGKTNWTKNDYSVSMYCNDSDSGCETGTKTETVSSTKQVHKTTAFTMKDKAGNSATCAATDINVYVDKTGPTCSLSEGKTNWTNTNFTISKYCSDSHSGCRTATQTETVSSTKKTHTTTAYTIKDNVGNETTCPASTLNVYVDKTRPTCTHSNGKTTWKNEDYKIKKGCSDSDSGCVTTTVLERTISSTKKIHTFEAYTIKDNAGNTRNCAEVEVNVYVDKTKPSVTIKTNTSYTGALCIDYPTKWYGYRHEVDMKDNHSGLKTTTCTYSSQSKSRSLNGTTDIIREQLCHYTNTVSCTACDKAGNCRTKSQS